MMKDVSIISTGNELLQGAIDDSNSSFISRQLFPANLRVRRHLAVSDRLEDIAGAVRYCLHDSDIILITGGLGPTDDDLTLEALQAVFGYSTVCNEESLDKMKAFFLNLGRIIDEADLKMVSVPETSIVLENYHGLAPGFILEQEGKSIIALPGVPREMYWMLKEKAIPYLKNRFGSLQKSHMTLVIAGMKESTINERIKALKAVDSSLQWGITARSGIATVTLIGNPGKTLDEELIYREAREVFGDNLLLRGNFSPEEEVVQLLKEHGITLAVAESCTGGMVAARITDVPGASEVFRGGIVAYNDDIKAGVLDVDMGILKNHGAVSEQVVGSMVKKISVLFSSQWGISVSRIAGPGGGSPEKPVGTVCFGFGFGDEIISETRHIPGDRERVRMYSVFYAIDRVRRRLREIGKN